MTNVDVLRVVCALLSIVLVVGMVVCAIELRGDRQWGCYCVALFALATTIGNVQRIHQAPTFATYVGAAAVIFGLLYVLRVITKREWRSA